MSAAVAAVVVPGAGVPPGVDGCVPGGGAPPKIVARASPSVGAITTFCCCPVGRFGDDDGER